MTPRLVLAACACALLLVVCLEPVQGMDDMAGDDPFMGMLMDMYMQDVQQNHEKRPAPSFVGKRAHAYYQDYGNPMERRSPMFVGKRRPMFVGKRSVDNLLDESKRYRYFVGKKNDVSEEKRGRPMFVGKREDYDDKRSPMFVGKRDPLFDDSEDKRSPMFVGKRGDDKRSPMFVGKRQDDDEFDEVNDKRAPMFIGKKSIPWFGEKRRLFVGKRQLVGPYGSKRRLFVGKRDEDKRSPMFVGKRYYGRGSRLFIGKKASGIDTRSPMFVGKKSIDWEDIDTSEAMHKRRPMFVGKRGPPAFVGKRPAPGFVGKRSEEDRSQLLRNSEDLLKQVADADAADSSA